MYTGTSSDRRLPWHSCHKASPFSLSSSLVAPSLTLHSLITFDKCAQYINDHTSIFVINVYQHWCDQCAICLNSIESVTMIRDIQRENNTRTHKWKRCGGKKRAIDTIKFHILTVAIVIEMYSSFQWKKMYDDDNKYKTHYIALMLTHIHTHTHHSNLSCTKMKAFGNHTELYCVLWLFHFVTFFLFQLSPSRNFQCQII